MPRAIELLARSDVQRISGAQVVLDVRAVVKELIENALDAGATSIDVRFKEYGAGMIEVADNGTGIAQENYEMVAKPHHTSKLEEFEDLATVRTFGFRGEALAALCSLATVSMHTATTDDAPMSTHLTFRSDGSLASSDKKAARQRGTTVTVTDLFAHLPVRRRELEKNIKREYAKAYTILQAYALISRGVRWTATLSTQTGRRLSQLVVQAKDTDAALQGNVTAVFGAKAMSNLMPVALDFQLPKPDPFTDALHVSVRGLVSRPVAGAGRSSGDRQFFYVNQRPWESSKLARSFNDVYHAYNTNQVPCVIADVQLRTDAYDVNVSPDKRTIFMHQEAAFLDALRSALDHAFAPSRGVFAVDTLQQSDLNLLGEPGAKRRRVEDDDDSGERSADDEDVRDESPPSTSAHEGSGKHAVEAGRWMDSSAGTRAPAKMPELRSSPETRAHPRISTLHASWSDAPGSPSAECKSGTSPSSEDPAAQCESMRERFRRAVANFPSTTSESDQLASSLDRSDPASDVLMSSDALEYREDRDGEASDESGCDEEGKALSESDGEDGGVAHLTQDLAGHDDEQTTAVHPRTPSRHSQEEQSVISARHASSVADDGAWQGAPDAAGLYEDDQSESGGGILDRADEASPATHQMHSRESQARPPTGPVSPTTEELTAREAGSNDARNEAIVTLPFALAAVRERVLRRQKSPHQDSHQGSPQSADAYEQLVGAGVAERMEQAAATLDRVIQKTDFAAMRIIGQFNLGFIIARRTLSALADDLFIIDQHAADEKYNFEMLQQSTLIHNQPLVRPQRLELSPTDELVASEHVDWLRLNGFEVRVDEDAPPGARVSLLTKPVSRSTVFEVQDLSELLHMLRETAGGIHKHARPTKVRDMLASRACRKSIMVGSALDRSQMQRVVRHMGEIDQPWVRCA